MLFNSIPFAIFLPIVFCLYWLFFDRFFSNSKWQLKAQNVFLLAASYFFYGYANWKMLPLLMVSTIVFYFLGIVISQRKSERSASWLTALGVVLGVGLLLYFKYLNFFIDSFSRLFESVGLHTNWHTFNIVMPLGISFFTFKLISYVLEINRGKLEPTRDVVAFAAYIAFFPCILSGPIDRPQFMRQLKERRGFDYGTVSDGMRQVLWGLFKKVVVADNCALFVDKVLLDYTSQTGSTLLLAAVFYSFQIYADFSGYSDMAIGIGKLLGFKITRNFNYPFFALNIADYWRRWHMSLTTWLTDYLFTPLSIRFRDWGKVGLILAIFVNMVVMGLWHGANWTFVLFGLYHGLLFVPLILSGSFMKKAKLKTNGLGLPVLKDFGRMLLTFTLVTMGLILFRAESLGQAWDYVYGICNNSLFTKPCVVGYTGLVLNVLLLFVVEWIRREKECPLDLSFIKKWYFRWPVYFALLFNIFIFGGHTVNYIYFQF